VFERLAETPEVAVGGGLTAVRGGGLWRGEVREWVGWRACVGIAGRGT
jgi:hypothetical protein